MKTRLVMGTLSMLSVVFLLCVCVDGYAQWRTPEKDAEANVKKAIAYYKQYGREKAFAEFSNANGTGQFTDIKKELFIFAYDMNGKCLAQGANPGLIGKVLWDLKEADGKYMFRDMTEIAKTKGSGWYTYKWSNPSTKKIEWKKSYIERVDDFWIGCGVHKAI